MSHVVALAAHQGGFPLKAELVIWLQSLGRQVLNQPVRSLP
jgi:hypothetical protein